MRIRKCASRILGSAYSFAPPDPGPRFELSLPPPPPPARPTPAANESRAGSGGGFADATASGETCELSRSPWDLISELDLSDPQEEKNLVESYFVHVAGRASWLFPTCMPATSIKEELTTDDGAQPQHELAKKPHPKKDDGKEKEKKESNSKKKAKVKQEESDGSATGVVQVWTCKKSDGKRWFCQRPVSRPNSLCEYHFEQKRSYYNLFSESISMAAPSAASKPTTSSKIRRKKKPSDAAEGFYYYAGFGPSRTTKRHCRSSSMQESAPAEQEEEAPPEHNMQESARAEQEAQAATEDSMHESAPAEREDEALQEDSMHESAPAEQEEEAPPEHYAAPTADQVQADHTDHQAASHDGHSSRDNIAGIAGSDEESSDDTYGCNGNGKPRVVGVNGDIKRKSQWRKRWRKPIKARSLKSLM